MLYLSTIYSFFIKCDILKSVNVISPGVPGHKGYIDHSFVFFTVKLIFCTLCCHLTNDVIANKTQIFRNGDKISSHFHIYTPAKQSI